MRSILRGFWAVRWLPKKARAELLDQPAAARLITRRTPIAVHSPRPAAVGILRAVSSAATARSEAPPACNSAMIACRKAKNRAANIAPVIRDILAKGGNMSLRAVAIILEARGIKTPRGGSKWQAVQVQRVLAAAA